MKRRLPADRTRRRNSNATCASSSLPMDELQLHFIQPSRERLDPCHSISERCQGLIEEDFCISNSATEIFPLTPKLDATLLASDNTPSHQSRTPVELVLDEHGCDVFHMEMELEQNHERRVLASSLDHASGLDISRLLATKQAKEWQQRRQKRYRITSPIDMCDE